MSLYVPYIGNKSTVDGYDFVVLISSILLVHVTFGRQKYQDHTLLLVIQIKDQSSL